MRLLPLILPPSFCLKHQDLKDLSKILALRLTHFPLFLSNLPLRCFFSITSTQSNKVQQIFTEEEGGTDEERDPAVITDPSCPAFSLQSGFGYKLKAAIKVKV